jgi:hypothetical protein
MNLQIRMDGHTQDGDRLGLGCVESEKVEGVEGAGMWAHGTGGSGMKKHWKMGFKRNVRSSIPS